ncbi:hypothetical protein M0R72_06870 [Candidatus Pacearchaeota archaeon]|nr:hypothetical protein [Candidatus Pacearchaeota archaeon]
MMEGPTLTTILTETYQDLTERARLNDQILERLIILEKENMGLKSQINEHELRLNKQSEYIQDLKYAAKVAKPGKKSDARKKALADQLVATKNIGMTYAQIGKFLELGSRKNGKNTREQNMTHFGKLLEADKKSFVVTDGKTSGGKLVKLTKIYYEHLLRGEP